jgi:hypothetical protein
MEKHMASNKVKFEMSLEKLSFKFEGDYEKGQHLQQGISRTFGDLAKLQHQASGADYPGETKLLEAAVTERRPVRHRRRRTVAESEHGAATDNDDSGEPGPRKSSGVSIKELVLALKGQQFFETARTNAQVTAELNKKGHTHVRENHLTSTLKRLCTSDILKRDQNSEGIWVYVNGPGNG